MRNSLIIAMLLLVSPAGAVDNPCAGKKTQEEFHACTKALEPKVQAPKPNILSPTGAPKDDVTPEPGPVGK